MALKDLTYLSFELSPTCNMAQCHSFCPVNDPLRYPPHESHGMCSDMSITKFVEMAYSRGFSGFIGFHYYSDPLMNLGRLLNLASIIRHSKSDAKFVVWTNGVLLNSLSVNWLPFMDEVIITRHNYADQFRIEAITKGLNNVKFHDNLYDNRMNVYDCTALNKGGCSRPLKIEMPINYYGNVRLCCSDYRGSVSIGNIQMEDHSDVIDNFEESALSAQQGIIPICWRCRGLNSNTAVDL